MSTTENSLPSDDMPVTPNNEPPQTDPVLKVPPRRLAPPDEISGTPENSNAMNTGLRQQPAHLQASCCLTMPTMATTRLC